MSDITRDSVRQLTLSDGDVSVSILNLGCITQDWQVPLAGLRVPVVLGYDNPADYLCDPFFMGQIVGPVANRISGAGFDLGGVRHNLEANDPPHHLHGGPTGLGHQLWQMEQDGPQAVELRLICADGTGGYPGRVAYRVRILLSGACLTYDLRAETDRPTPVNLAQHNYYSLGAADRADAHRLWMNADHYFPTGPDLIPTGEYARVDGTALDFRTLRRVSDAIQAGPGLDSALVLNQDSARPSAIALADNGLELRMWSDQPSLQLYTAQHLYPGAPAHAGQVHGPFSGLCLEPQQFPDSLNQPGFPTVVIAPDQPYRQILRVEIKEGDSR